MPDATDAASNELQIHRGLQRVYFDRSAVCDIDGRAGKFGLNEGDTSAPEED